MASPEMERVHDLWRSFLPEGEPPPMEELRKSYDDFTLQFGIPTGLRREESDGGGVPIVWVSHTASAEDRVVIWFHSGGYCLGSPGGYTAIAHRIAEASQARVALVDYRLAPEHPFPAAVDDAVEAYRSILDSGIEARQVVIAGDSAGGGLAVTATLAIRDRALPVPAAVAALSGWFDLECLGESMITKAGVDPVTSKELLAMLAMAYLAGADARDPLASPVHADLSGLPALFLQVGSHEVLLDDTQRLAAIAEDSGVNVDVQVIDGAPHICHLFAPILPEGQAAIERFGAFVLDHT